MAFGTRALALALLAATATQAFIAPKAGLKLPAGVKRAASPMRMAVLEIGDEAQFDKAMSAAGDAVVVVDYSTTWCGPCKVISPYFAELSDKHTEAVFLKVVGDSSPEAQKLMKREGVRSVPAFHYFNAGEKVETVSGANPDAIEGALLKTLQSAKTA